MIIHNCAQGSYEWQQLKLGIPSASEFHKILTPAKLQLSAQAKKYAYRLVTEKLLNQQLVTLDTLEWIARGKEMEPEAARAYEFETGFGTTPVGFITTDDGRVGASPDRLLITGNDLKGGVELKCPAPLTQQEYIQEGFGTDYILQVQGQMWVAELDFVDRFAYHPQCPPYRFRTYRDEAVIRAICVALDGFHDIMATVMAKALEAGPWTASETYTGPIEATYGDAA